MAKYGRLFTEDDVLTLIQGAFEAGVSAGQTNPHLDADGLSANYPAIFEYLCARSSSLTFPADEPLFLLRGQDKAAANAIATRNPEEQEYGGAGDYYTAALVAGAAPHHLDAIANAADAMRVWQRANLDRVKVPD